MKVKKNVNVLQPLEMMGYPVTMPAAVEQLEVVATQATQALIQWHVNVGRSRLVQHRLTLEPLDSKSRVKIRKTLKTLQCFTLPGDSTSFKLTKLVRPDLIFSTS